VSYFKILSTNDAMREDGHQYPAEKPEDAHEIYQAVCEVTGYQDFICVGTGKDMQVYYGDNYEILLDDEQLTAASEITKYKEWFVKEIMLQHWCE